MRLLTSQFGPNLMEAIMSLKWRLANQKAINCNSCKFNVLLLLDADDVPASDKLIAQFDTTHVFYYSYLVICDSHL